MCSIKIKVWVTVVASGAMDLKNFKKWLKAIESELKITRSTLCSDVAVVLRSVLNIPQTVTSTTRWAFKEKSDLVLRQDRLFSDGGKSIILIME